MIGESPASGWPVVVSRPVVLLNTLPPHTSPVWLRLGSSALVSGQVLTNTTWTAASCVPMSNPLLGHLFFPTKVFITLLVPRPGRVCLPKLRPRFVNRVPGAGVWLFALPDSPESHIPAPPFRVSLRRRLRMPIWTQDINCTLCGQVMDKWSHHALVCGCGGGRVTRHNLVRDVVRSAANDRASLGAVLEKPGLLIPRDPSDDDRPLGPDPPDPSSPSRRLADVSSPGAPAAAKRPGISPSPVLCALVRLCLIPRLFQVSSPLLSPSRMLF